MLQREHVVGAAVWLELYEGGFGILFSDLRFRLAHLLPQHASRSPEDAVSAQL